jgi:hypothetical protein
VIQALAGKLALGAVGTPGAVFHAVNIETGEMMERGQKKPPQGFS